jgi:hypothetical protein
MAHAFSKPELTCAYCPMGAADWPWSLLPQQARVPSVFTAQVCAQPALISARAVAAQKSVAARASAAWLLMTLHRRRLCDMVSSSCERKILVNRRSHPLRKLAAVLFAVMRSSPRCPGRTSTAVLQRLPLLTTLSRRFP